MRQIRSREPFSSEALTPLERRLCDWLADRRDAMIVLLAEVVNIDSGSSDKAGRMRWGVRFRRFFVEHSLETAPISRETRGGILKAKLAGRNPVERASVLLMGHCDTVFGKGEAARRPSLSRATAPMVRTSPA